MKIIKSIYSILSLSEKRKAIKLIVLMALGSVFEVVSVGLIIPLIGLVSQPESFISKHMSSLLGVINFEGGGKELLLFSAMLFLFVIFIKLMYLNYLAWLQNDYVYSCRANLSQRLFYEYMLRPWSYHFSQNSAQLINILTNETNQFGVSALSPALVLISEAMVLLGITFLLFYVEPLATLLIALFLLSISLLFYGLTHTYLIKSGRTRLLNEGLRVQQVKQSLQAIKDVKLSGREGFFIEEYNHYNKVVASTVAKQATILQVPKLWIDFLVVFSFTMLVFVVFFEGDASLDYVISRLLVFAVGALRILPSIIKIVGAVQNIQASKNVVELIQRDVGNHREIIAPSKKDIHFQKSLILRGVTFRYPESSRYVLKDVSFEIRKGSYVGFVGDSGSGKSTLIDIITGLIEPDRGSVEVDGNNIQGGVRSWQNLVGYVPQTTYLRDESLRKNIAYGVPENQINEELLLRVIGDAQLDDFVQSLPLGLETKVGEAGVKISGGQRQRIAIARALYKNPQVLILDEATSALDRNTERKLMDIVDGLVGEMTVIVVAHNPSIMKSCSDVFNISKGEVVKIS